MNDQIKKIFRKAFSNWSPPPSISMWEWAERSIVLSPRQATGFPGPYRCVKTPYVKGVFDALQDRSIHTVVVRKGAQTGLTLTAYIALGYWAVNDPGPVLMVYPSENGARSASESRVMPMFEDSPALSAEIPDNPDEWTKLQYRLKRCTVNWVGSNSPANLASRPIRYLVADETDKFPEASNKEAAPLDLAIQRTKTFWNRKIVLISTPTTTEGPVNTYFLMGDQRQYFVPCHACGQYQVMAWDRIRWDAGKAWYECESCKAKWTDDHKRKAVARGEWRATVTPKVEGMASFHLPSFCAPWVTFKDLTAKFLRYSDKMLWDMDKIKRISALHDFVNSELGEPWEQVTVKPQVEVIATRSGQYMRGKHPFEHEPYKTIHAARKVVRYMTVDVQQTHLMCLIREWASNGDSGLVDHRMLVMWQDVEAWAAEHGVFKVAVDVGYPVRASEVRNYCGTYSAIPMLGQASMKGMKWSRFDPWEGMQKQGQAGDNFWMLHFRPDAIKDRLWQMIEGKGVSNWMTYGPIDAEYARHMTSEHAIDGKWKLIKSHGQNHFWDCEVMQIALARAMEMLPDYSLEVEQ